MTLAKRLLIGSLVLVTVLVLGVVAIAGSRLRDRLADETRRELEREARVVGSSWVRTVNADSLANTAGAALKRRVTLIDSTGVAPGESLGSTRGSAGSRVRGRSIDATQRVGRR